MAIEQVSCTSSLSWPLQFWKATIGRGCCGISGHDWRFQIATTHAKDAIIWVSGETGSHCTTISFATVHTSCPLTTKTRTQSKHFELSCSFKLKLKEKERSLSLSLSLSLWIIWVWTCKHKLTDEARNLCFTCLRSPKIGTQLLKETAHLFTSKLLSLS